MTWVLPPQTPWVADSGTVWMLNADGGEVFGLDGAAGLIWEAADGATNIDDLVARLVDLHGWNAENIRDHVETFVAELADRGLLQERAQ